MKKSDIKVGGRYAYTAYEGSYVSGSAEEVEVIDIDVPISAKSSHSGRRSQRQVTGSRIRFIDGRRKGNEVNVSNREIREEWDLYKAYVDKMKESRERTANELRAAHMKRAATFFLLDQKVREVDPDAKVERRYIGHGGDLRDAAREAGFEIIDDAYIETVLGDRPNGAGPRGIWAIQPEKVFGLLGAIK